MAEIVFGFGTSHGPLLATPPHEWDLRANVDRKNKALAFGAGTYDFQKLYELRKGEHFEKQNTLDVRSERDARCQHQLDVLGERLAKVNPDVLIIVGDDHHEWFLNDIQPAFSIFHARSAAELRSALCPAKLRSATGFVRRNRRGHATSRVVFQAPGNSRIAGGRSSRTDGPRASVRSGILAIRFAHGASAVDAR